MTTSPRDIANRLMNATIEMIAACRDISQLPQGSNIDVNTPAWFEQAASPEPENTTTQATQPTPEPVAETPEATRPNPDLEPQPEQQPEEQPAAAETPTEPVITLEEVRAKMVNLSRTKGAAAAKEIITNAGYAKLSDIPADKYPDVVALVDQAAA